MHKTAVSRHPRERGQAIVLMVLVVVALLGMIGLAVDGGRLYMERRSVQNAADNAALAGAYALCNSGNVVGAAGTSAVQNGYTPSPPNVVVVVQNPPSIGPNAGDAEYVAVSISSRPALTFGRLVYSGTAETTARAVARCSLGGGPAGWGNGLVALNPDAGNVVYGPSSGCIVVNGGGIFVNSSHANAMYMDGGDGATCPAGTRMKADWIQVVGGAYLPPWVPLYGNPLLYMQPYPPQEGQAPRLDPLASVPVPPISAAAPQPNMPGCTPAFINSKYNGGNVVIDNHWCTNQVTLYPGRYTSLTITSDAGRPPTYSPVILSPGLYYIDNFFTVNGDGRVVGNGVTFYIATGAVNLGGSGQATLSAPAVGIYEGLVFFMSRANGSSFIVNGGSTLSLTGTVYGPLARIESSGSGVNKTVNGQFIANRFYVTGGGQLAINYDSNVVYQVAGASLIQLSE